MSYERTNEQPRQVRIPFIRKPIGSGDVVARATRRLGIKPCAPCKKRQAMMNRWLRFVPR